MKSPHRQLDRELNDLAGKLSQATKLEEFMEVRRLANAIQELAHAACASADIEIRAAEIRLNAERRVGRLLIHIALAHGGRPAAEGRGHEIGGMGQAPKGKKNRSHCDTSLESLGLNKNRSARRQKEARVPEKEYRRYLVECRAAGRPGSSAGLLKFAERLAAEGKLLKSKRAADGKKARDCLGGDVAENAAKSRETSSFRRSHDAMFLLEESLGHVGQLKRILNDFYGGRAIVQPTDLECKHVERLLIELTKMLRELRACHCDEGPE